MISSHEPHAPTKKQRQARLSCIYGSTLECTVATGIAAKFSSSFFTLPALSRLWTLSSSFISHSVHLKKGNDMQSRRAAERSLLFVHLLTPFP